MYSKVSDFITSGMRVALIAAASIFLAACNDDASAPSVPSGGGDSPTPPVASTAGYVVDAPVTGAICNLYAITDGVAGTTVLAADTSNAGALDFGAVDHTGAAFVDCSGGTFTDEATGETLSAPDMSAVIDMTPGETYVVSLLTEIATRLAEATGDLGTALTEHNAAVADNFGLDSTDITTQVPTDLNAEAAQDDEAGHYGTVIALLSQMVEDGTAGETRDEVLTAITSDLEDDGKMSADSATAMDQAMTNFAEGDSAAKANMDTEVATAVTQSSGTGVRPVAAAGDDQSVAAGASVNLTGVGTDEDGTIASYAWELTTGSGVDLTNADAAEASFTAPSAAAASTLVFTLTVTDNDGNQHTDTVTISVAAAAAGQNITPVANAGDDQSVAAGASVTVTGTGTDQDGSIATYAWEEVSSSGVTLSGADSATLTFTAPSAASASTLEFKLTVTDDDGATASDNVKVDVAAQAAVGKTDQAAVNAGADVSKTVGDAAFTQAASGGSGTGAVTYTSSDTSVATVAAGGVVTIEGAGNTTITATRAADDNYNAASDTYALTVAKASDTIEAGDDVSKTVGDAAFTQAASGGSGTGAVTYTSSDTSVATVAAGGVVTIEGAGNTTITATRAADDNYNAASDTYALTVAKASDTIEAGDDVSKTTLDSPFTQAASGGSGTGAVTYTSSDTSVATVVAGGVVTIQGAGNTTITATRAADDNYNAASDTYALTVAKASDTIEAGDDVSKTVGDAAFTQAASGGSGTGAVTYTSSDTSVATVAAGGVVTIEGAGNTTITATRAADDNYNAASDTYALTVAKASDTIEAGDDVSKTTLDSPFTQAASGGSGTGAVTYTSSDTSVATVVAGGVVTIQGAGNTTITATRAADDNYNAASDTYALTVAPGLVIDNIKPTGGTLTQDSSVDLSANMSLALGSGVAGKTFTITGNGFGVSVGSGSVTFQSDVAGAAISATITSWGDTSIVVEAPGVTLNTAGAQEAFTVTVTDSGGSNTTTSAFTYDDCDTCRLNDNCPF